MAVTRTRIGGHVVVECLEALGADTVFGLPGIHALAIWDGLRESRLRYLGFRTELNAGFAADGYARASGKPAPLLLSTGPGALNSLTALMEAASAHVPVVAIASQIPRELIGQGRGYLHELPDQRASFAPLVKWTGRAERPAEVPQVLAEAWRQALDASQRPGLRRDSGGRLDGRGRGRAREPARWQGGSERDPGRRGSGALDRCGRAPRSLGRRRRQPLRRLARAGSPGGASPGSRRDVVHGQGSLPRGSPARSRLGGGRGRLQGARRKRRRPRVHRDRARRGDDRPVFAEARRADHPGRCRRGADRRHVSSTRTRRRCEGGSRESCSSNCRPESRTGRPSGPPQR